MTSHRWFPMVLEEYYSSSPPVVSKNSTATNASSITPVSHRKRERRLSGTEAVRMQSRSWTAACTAIQTSIVISFIFSSVLLRTLFAMCFDVWYGQHNLWCNHVHLPSLSLTHIYIYIYIYIGSLHDKLEPSFQVVYTKKLPTLSGKIMSDPSHILYEKYSFLPSNIRLRVAYARLNWLCYVNLLCISL